jgi:hypothetical protein
MILLFLNSEWSRRCGQADGTKQQLVHVLFSAPFRPGEDSACPSADPFRGSRQSLGTDQVSWQSACPMASHGFGSRLCHDFGFKPWSVPVPGFAQEGGVPVPRFGRAKSGMRFVMYGPAGRGHDNNPEEPRRFCVQRSNRLFSPLFLGVYASPNHAAVVTLNREGNSANGLARPMDPQKRTVNVRPGDLIRFRAEVFKVKAVEADRWSVLSSNAGRQAD